MLNRINAAVLLVAALFTVTGCQGQVLRPAADSTAGGRGSQASASPALDTVAARRREVKQADQLLGQGKTAEAIAVLRQVVNNDPEDPDAWNLLTVAFQRENDAPAAVVAGRRALQLAPQSMTVRYNLGLAMLLNGQSAEALSHLQQAAEAVPGPDPLLALARAYQHMAVADEDRPAEWLSKAVAELDRLEKEFPQSGLAGGLRPYVLPDFDGDGMADRVKLLGYTFEVTSGSGATLLQYQVPTAVREARWAVLELGASRPVLVVYWYEPAPAATVFDFSAAAGLLQEVGTISGSTLTLGPNLRHIATCGEPCEQPEIFQFLNGAWSLSRAVLAQ